MNAQQPYIWWQLRDDSGSLSTQRWHIRRDSTVQAAQNAAGDVRLLLGGCTGCVYLRQDVVYPAVELSRQVVPAGADARRVGVFVFSTVEPAQYAIVAVPGIKLELLVAGVPGADFEIDIEHTDVVELVAELTSGLYCNRFGYTITALESAYAQVRNELQLPQWLQ